MRCRKQAASNAPARSEGLQRQRRARRRHASHRTECQWPAETGKSQRTVVSVASVAHKAWRWQQCRRTSMYAHHTGTERKSDTARSYSAVIASTSSALLERRDERQQATRGGVGEEVLLSPASGLNLVFKPLTPRLLAEREAGRHGHARVVQPASQATAPECSNKLDQVCERRRGEDQQPQTTNMRTSACAA